MLYDSNFLISLSGSRGRAQRTAAEAFLAAHPDNPVYTSRICWAEFAEGCETREAVDDPISPFTVLEINEHIAWEASRISRSLDRRGLPIGDNDVWIAATAKVYRLPLVSRNAKHFARVPGLDIEEY